MDDKGLPEDVQTNSTAGPKDELLGSGTKTPHTRLSRKRTKTGCLTCRRRRIKCGEERPTCGNCIKSKRQCEGYNQRVIFKDPLSTYRVPSSAISANSSFSTGHVTSLSAATQYGHFHHTPHPHNASLPNIAPKTSPSFQNQILTVSVPHDDPSQGGSQRSFDVFSETNPGHEANTTDVPGHGASTDPLYDTVEPSYLPQVEPLLRQQTSSGSETRYDLDNSLGFGSTPTISQSQDSLYPKRSSGSSCASEPPLQELVYHSNIRDVASALLTQSYQGSANWPVYMAQQNPSHPKYVSNMQPRSNSASIEQPLKSQSLSGSENLSWNQNVPKVKHPEDAHVQYNKQELVVQDWPQQEHLLFIATRQQNSDSLDANNEPLMAGVITGDNPHITALPPNEEFFDKSDDEMGPEEYDVDPEGEFGKRQFNHLKNNDLGKVVALQAFQDRQDQRLRTYHSFLDGYSPDMLATYEPSPGNSPLSDSITARIFCYFINVTGPSISLFERHPPNPSLMLQGRPVPTSQQHIWAYTMPTLALNNQALLHAMLAIGSLHMALLQDRPITASLKHYHIAIRRIAKSVRLPMRRGQPATLAATLLLGWYELMSADHQKWTSHLLGARQLIKEIDFAGMTRYLKNRKTQQQKARHGNLYHHEMALGIREGYSNMPLDNGDDSPQVDVNENIVGMIMGKKLRYDQYGQVLEDIHAGGDEHKIYTQRELEIYENQRDLFWWYCKQDTFQSILSGNRLFMHYDLWSHCPPRAAIGRQDATYGTFDHLILLLGRLAEFAAKDLPRKRKAMQMKGSQWRAPAGAAGQSNTPETGGPPQPGPPRMPTFAGMMPGTEGKTSLPRGFSPAREESPASEGTERNLEEWIAEAVEEWHEIRTTFNILEENYGPDFQPLGPEHSQPIQSPFGPALQYRTYSIAGIWMVHYMGLILCHRYHPSMPPAATVAAGVAARHTAVFANQIGRISAAISPNAAEVTQVPTGVGAGLIESSFGLFIAGVQYQDSTQRSWLIQRLFDIKRLTGWKTASAIATGCESSWVKAAEAGRGPPYVRVAERKTDQNIWYTARRRVDHVLSERHDREKLIVARTDRVHYALGLLGVEEDFENLAFETEQDQNSGAE